MGEFLIPMAIREKLLAVIEGLEPAMRLEIILAHALASATRIAVKGYDPTEKAADVVAYLGMARDLASSHTDSEGRNPLMERYRRSVYGALDYARGRAAQRMRANGGLPESDVRLLEGVEIPEGKGSEAALVRSSADQMVREAQKALSVLLAYKA
ncbi:hypothetical protein HYV82_00380 [Candidatus Woesearchaeota archaeon]|nr:hypothetical protein [Candidatus Woesearchaeota archaeon]